MVGDCERQAAGPERLAVGTYSASPLLADGKVYLTNEDGLTTVLKAGPSMSNPRRRTTFRR